MRKKTQKFNDSSKTTCLVNVSAEPTGSLTPQQLSSWIPVQIATGELHLLLPTGLRVSPTAQAGSGKKEAEGVQAIIKHGEWEDALNCSAVVAPGVGANTGSLSSCSKLNMLPSH